MYLRKLPSGLWQCTVRGKDGKKHTETDKLKSVVKQWGTEQEAAMARGEWRDPRAGTIEVGECYARAKYMRHTAASWLVQDGVPLYDVQALLGHESFRTTERHAHLAPDAHDRVLKSWAGRTSKDAGARVAHSGGKRD